MGLGESAQGATAFMAMLVYGALALAVLVLALVLRRMTHHWRSSIVLVSGVAGVVLVVVVADYLRPEARELRKATELSRQVGVALDLDAGTGDGFERSEKRECLHGNRRGWIVSTIANPLSFSSSVPDEDLHAMAEKLQTGLARMGMSTGRGQTTDGRFVRRWISGRRGVESVLVTVSRFGSVMVDTEVSNCLDLDD